MDFISHGLWGGILFGRKNKKAFWQSFFIGIAPDVFSFGVFFATIVLGLVKRPNFGLGTQDPSSFSTLVHLLYNITHSLAVFGAVFLLVWLVFKKPFLPLWAWGVHVALDIFTHSFEFFPTPFLWPISDFKVDAWKWGNWWIFLPNVALLIFFYTWFLLGRRRRKKLGKNEKHNLWQLWQ